MAMKKKKKTNPRKKVITEAEARIIINRAMDKAIHDLSIIALCVAAMSAHDVYDHGPKRLERLIIDMLRKFRDWDDGLFTVEDARQWLEDYTGIKIEDMEVPRG